MCKFWNVSDGEWNINIVDYKVNKSKICDEFCCYILNIFFVLVD